MTHTAVEHELITHAIAAARRLTTMLTVCCLQAPPLTLNRLQAECLAKVMQAAHIVADLAPSARSTLLSVNVAVAARHHSVLTKQRTVGGPVLSVVPRTEVCPLQM
jgi:hypothetical protein